MKCLTCAKRFGSALGALAHFESGRCPGCLGEETACKKVHQLISKQKGAQNLLVNTPAHALEWKGDSAPSEWKPAPDTNYPCNKCHKQFKKLSALVQHRAASARCADQGSQLSITSYVPITTTTTHKKVSTVEEIDDAEQAAPKKRRIYGNREDTLFPFVRAALPAPHILSSDTKFRSWIKSRALSGREKLLVQNLHGKFEESLRAIQFEFATVGSTFRSTALKDFDIDITVLYDNVKESNYMLNFIKPFLRELAARGIPFKHCDSRKNPAGVLVIYKLELSGGDDIWMETLLTHHDNFHGARRHAEELANKHTPMSVEIALALKAIRDDWTKLLGQNGMISSRDKVPASVVCEQAAAIGCLMLSPSRKTLREGLIQALTCLTNWEKHLPKFCRERWNQDLTVDLAKLAITYLKDLN